MTLSQHVTPPGESGLFMHKNSAHAVPKPLTSTSVVTITAAHWLADAVETCRDAKMRPPKLASLPVFRLVKLDAGWECIVSRTIEKPVVFESTGATKFSGIVDYGDASLLDGYFTGKGHGSQLRDADAAKVMAVFASAMNPTHEEARTLAKALSIRCALRRGVSLEGYEVNP